jgi:hypothetical protein
MREPTAQEWADYISVVKHQLSLIDRLTPENKQFVWDHGFDAVLVRRMLADQRRTGRAKANLSTLPPEPPLRHRSRRHHR